MVSAAGVAAAPRMYGPSVSVETVLSFWTESSCYYEHASFFTLQALFCRLYVTVITTIRGFGDLFWVDVVEQIDTMTEQVNNFQNQAKKLPKALRDWQAFVDCKKVIDDFLEELPLFQQLASKAMRPRYVQYCLIM